MRTSKISSFDFLLQLLDTYKDESEKCRRQGAYLGACVLLGSALEAGLLAMARSYPSEVRRSKTYLQRKSRGLNKWGLFDLLKLATELGWIPSRLSLDKTARSSRVSPHLARSRGDLGYFADIVREIRDMVHPGRYLRYWKGERVSRRYHKFCYTVTDQVFTSLYEKLESSIMRASVHSSAK